MKTMATASLSARETRAFPGPRTARALWRFGVEQGRRTPAYLEQTGDGYREVAWEEAARRVDALAHGLLARGVQPGDAVAILSRTRLEWALLDWAVMSIGAVVVGLYPTSSASECGYILEHSESVLLLVEDAEQRAKVESLRERLPRLRDVLGLDELATLEHEGPAHLTEPLPELVEDDPATLIYTSGTTGPPKGVILTHRNVVAAATQTEHELVGSDDVLLLFLPLAHVYGRLVHYSAAFHGFTIAFCADVADLAESLREVGPTVLPAVPRVYEKIHAAVTGEIERSPGPKRAIGRWALRVGAEASRLQRSGTPLPPGLRVRRAIAARLLFAKVKARLGGRLRFGVSGAAPLSLDVLEFFHALDVLVVEGYGLTETVGVATANHPDELRFGTVGAAREACEIAVADDGELLIRGDVVFAGYYKDPAATRAVLTDDGWFRTGDVGEIDTDGFVTITDRMKDIIITAGGKNIAPQNLENALTSSRFVSQALVVGDRRPYVIALITLDEAETRASGRDPHELVQELVDEINRDQSRATQIKRFTILPRHFTEEHGEVTPTLKLRRRVVHEHFAEEIERLYAP
jgi:long-chain acyl-CoA synthetase